MKTLDKQSFEEIRRWIYRNARPLDLAIWQCLFEDGSQETVLSILSYYQNDDGGFGGPIEPDNWNPESSPYKVQHVIRMLCMIDFYDVTHPVYQGIFRFLKNTGYKADFGWFFITPANDAYPHASWWDYPSKDNEFQSVGITAILSGFILKHGKEDQKLYQMACDFTKTLIKYLSTASNFGDMGVKGYCRLAEDIEAAGLTEVFDYPYLCERLHTLVRGQILTNHFMANPLEFVPTQSSSFYDENKIEVEAALDRIIDQRPEQGVWDIPWEWYNGNKYPKAFAISENWWKSYEAIDKLLQLKRFGRLTL